MKNVRTKTFPVVYNLVVFTSLIESSIISTNCSSFRNYLLLYSPSNTAISEIMQPFKLVFKDVKAFNSSSEMEDYYVTSSRNTTFAGIQFDDNLLNGNDLGSDRNVNFALRYVFFFKLSK